MRRDESAGERRGRHHRHLLAEHGPHRQFGRVVMPGDPAPGSFQHERPEQRVAAEAGGDHAGVDVEAQEPHRGGARLPGVARVGEVELAAHMVAPRRQRDDPGPVRQPEAAAVRAVLDGLDARDRATREEGDEPAGGERGRMLEASRLHGSETHGSPRHVST